MNDMPQDTQANRSISIETPLGKDRPLFTKTKPKKALLNQINETRNSARFAGPSLPPYTPRETRAAT